MRRFRLVIVVSLISSVVAVGPPTLRPPTAAAAAPVAPSRSSTLGFTGLAEPTGVALDGLGGVYVSTYFGHVERSAPDGTQTRLAFTGLNHPGGLDVDVAGNVIVADTANNRIVELSSGSAQTTLAVSGLSAPADVAVDAAGDLFVADAGNNRVVEVGADGNQVVLPVSGLNHPSGVAVDGIGNLFVADSGNNRVLRVSPTNVVTQLPFALVGGVNDVAVDGAGNVYATDPTAAHVDELAPDGTQTQVGFAPMTTPSGLAVDGHGNVYASDFDHDLVNEVVVSGFPAVIPTDGLDGPEGIAVSDDGDVVVSDTGNARVVSVSPAGVQTELPFQGLDRPAGVTVGTFGDLYVADSANHRVVSLPPDGDQVTWAFQDLVDPRAVVEVPNGHQTPTLWVSDAGAGTVETRTPTAQSRLAAGLNDPQGLIGPTRAFVAESGAGTIDALPLGGQTLGSGLSAPSGLSSSPAGDIEVADTGNNRVVELPRRGSQTVLPFSGLSEPKAVAVDKAGNTFVADSGNNRVVELPADLMDEPTGVTATLGSGSASSKAATVSWVAPPVGPAGAITGYAVTPLVDGHPLPPSTFSSTATTQRVTGLRDGTAYTFTVQAFNGSGLGASSAPSNSVTPFQPTVGLLRVVTSPAVPSQITVDGAIADTWGLKWVKQGPGSHTVCFADVPGYTTPPCQTVTVVGGETSTVTGTFVPRGYLHVVTSPGANSRISVDGVPRNNWGLWTDLTTGSHQVCFGAVAGLTPPPCQTVTVTAGATTTVTGSFTVSAASGPTGVGLLRVTTTPAVASQITVDGAIADTWGLNWLQVAPGAHTVCFSHVEGYTEPSCSTANVGLGTTATVAGSFVQRGFVNFDTGPPSASTITVNGVIMDDWGVFTDLPVGPVTACWGPVPGHATPACYVGSVTAGTVNHETGGFP